MPFNWGNVIKLLHILEQSIGWSIDSLIKIPLFIKNIIIIIVIVVKIKITLVNMKFSFAPLHSPAKYNSMPILKVSKNSY